MRKGDRKVIEVGKRKLESTYLGQGHYARAFLVGNLVYLFVREHEYMKDLIVEMCDPMPHIPKIKRYEETTGTFCKIYSMPYYENISPKHKEAWKIFKTLKTIAADVHTKRYLWNKPLWLHGNYFGCDVIDATMGKVPLSVTRALQSLINAGGNYGCGVTFEFGKRNIGVDKKGRIVFRDIMFDAEKIHREFQKKRSAISPFIHK